MPLHKTSDVDRDVALGELEGFGDVVERERVILEVQDGEYPSLQL
jgi:hypothetical protein